MRARNPAPPLPGEDLDVEKMPAYLLLARLGKRVLRPGGRGLSIALLDALGLGSGDRVVEMAPGLGSTTQLIAARHPQSYVGVERDRRAANIVSAQLPSSAYSCRVGSAQSTGLDDSSASVVIGEAFLSMQPDSAKRAILAEAYRVLEPGGRLGVHELALRPDGLGGSAQDGIRADLSAALRVGARPLTVADWKALMEDTGFVIEKDLTAPMMLIHPTRIIEDEGLLRALRIGGGVLRSGRVRRRVLGIRRTFARHSGSMCAVAVVARKP